jgi:hypothetical protein
MLTVSIENRLPEIRRICALLGVRRLAFFGSVLRGDFGPESDVDVLVSFARQGRLTPFEQYFELKEGLEKLLDRRVDLVTQDSIRNPVFRCAVEESRLLVYGESQTEAFG